MSEEFNTTVKYIEKMKSRYFIALSAFYLYEALSESLASNIHDKETLEENLKIFKRFNNFFGPSKEALRVYFFLELAKLFDASNQSLHINKVINYTQSNISKLTVDDFKEYDQNREFIEHLIKDYQGVSNDDLLLIKNEIGENETLISKIKDYRDQYLAHSDVNQDDISISGLEILTLFNLIEKILNVFSSKLISTTSMYDHVERNAKDEVDMMVDHLKRFEPYRIKEIEDEYQRDLKKHNIKP